jgi:hypothetical protein
VLTDRPDRHRWKEPLMYAALWRVLPGPVWVRILILIALVAVVLVVLVQWVFPWAADTLLPQESTVGG